MSFAEVFKRESLGNPTARIVGQESTGILLCTWVEGADAAVGAKAATVIASFSLERKTLKPLLRLPDARTIVHATVSYNETLLVFSSASEAFSPGRQVPQPDGSTATPTVQYETFMTLINPKSPQVLTQITWSSASVIMSLQTTELELLHRSTQRHRSQFLHDETPQAGAYHLLFAIHNHAILRYNIKVLQSGGIPVIDRSLLLSERKVLQEAFVWSQWDMATKRIWLIAARKGSDALPTFELRSFSFSSKGWHKVEAVAQLPIEVHLTLSF